VAHRFSGGERESADVRDLLSPTPLAEELGLLQSRGEAQIAAWVREAFAKDPQAVQDALSSPKKRKAARGFLSGQVMKLSAGKADPNLVGRLIEKGLAKSADNE